MTCAQVRHSLGADVLGALSPAEATELSAHLQDCVECRAEHDQLAATLPLLATVTPAEVEAGPPRPDPALLERMLARVAEERRTERERLAAQWRRPLVAAAAVAVAILGPWAVVSALRAPSGPPDTPGASATTAHRQVSGSDATTGASIAVSLSPVPWGTRLEMHLDGVRAGERCKLVVVGRTGEREVAASWEANYRGFARVDGLVALPTEDIVRVDVVTLAGRRLVSARA